MTDPYILEHLTLTGFRAYLEPAEFDFSSKRSLAIFAPNGKGKSSLVDGLEFMFSPDGTLRRLGTRTINNNAGFVALEHNLAAGRGIAPSVSIRFRKGNRRPDGLRPAAGSQRPRPDVASEVAAQLVVDPIVRGYELRHFVESQSATERYEEVARWLDLSALVAVQFDLKDLRRKLKASVEDQTDYRAIDAQLRRRTNATLATWDAGKVVAFANAQIAVLDAELSLAALQPTDPALQILTARAAEEEAQLGITGLRQLRTAAVALFEAVDVDGFARARGAIEDLKEALATLAAARVTEAAERRAAADAAFDNVWRAAAPLFAEGAAAPDACPVCATPLDRTAAGSAEAIRHHIAKHQAGLAEYSAAKEALGTAEAAVATARGALGTACATLISRLADTGASLKPALDGFAEALRSAGDEMPDSEGLKSSLAAYTGGLDAQIKAIADHQGESTYAKVLSLVRDLVELGADHAAAARKTAELEKIARALDDQAHFISTEIRRKVQAVLDSLQAPINAIYREIQREGAVPIRLELPDEGDTTQHRLNLVVDFAANRRAVQPGGYLSDSQIHSLALALRLAAIERCNAAVPLLVLDDIVTSYDADHRRAIASLLAKAFTNTQIILTTHDDRFFACLRDQLGDGRWRFTRIVRVDPDFGPRFSDQNVADADIERRWAEGGSAAGEMRQAEEEWLLQIARDFRVDIPIRSLERAYSYERAELAEAVGRFLKSADYEPPVVPGVNNRFLTSLRTGVVENFGAHFQDGQYGVGSIGDEKVRWGEFKHFRDLFRCPGCGKDRFQRPHPLKKPVCSKCETPFTFSAPDPSLRRSDGDANDR